MADLATTDLANAPFTWKTLNMIADTEMVPRGLRGNPPAMYAAIIMGRELGLGPMQSMQMIDVIDGRPALSAELQTAMIRNAGHSIVLSEFNDRVAAVKGRRGDNGDEITITFTIEMAERAGLTGKRNWRQYPEAMLWARALSMLSRMLFADVFAVTHAYTADELGSGTDQPTIPATVVNETLPEIRDDPDPFDALEDALFAAIAVDIRSAPTMDDIETALRTMCRCAEAFELIHAPLGASSWLSGQLANVGAKHVKDLKRVELEDFTLSVRADIAEVFSRYNNAKVEVGHEPDAAS